MNTKTLILSIVIIFIISFTSIAQIYQASTYNIRDYGAEGDDKMIETHAIQKAIDKCHQDGGGTVYFPSGVYLSGSLQLKSNVSLFLDAGAVLKGSPELSDYKQTSFVSESRSTSLIFAYQAENISILGQGTINGNDSAYFDWDQIHPGCCLDPNFTRQGASYSNRFPDGPVAVKGDNHDMDRPGALVTFIECKNVRIQDIRVVGSPNWCLHLACCDGVNIHGVDVRNSLLVPNADAIDVSKSRNVVISDSYLEAGDDGIAIGTCADGYCSQVAENITISNCTILTRSAGIRLGWSTDDIRNCTFQNLVIHANRGIGIFTRHDETIENILFSNIIINTRLHSGWWGNGEPIHMSEIPLGQLHGITSAGKNHGKIRNIRFSNIQMTGESGNVIYAYHLKSIQDISFDRIQFHLKNSSLNKDFGGNFDFRPAFADSLAVFEHEIPAFYAYQVKGLSFDDIKLTSEALPEFYTQGIFIGNSEEVRINRFIGVPLQSDEAIKLVQSKDILIRDSRTRKNQTELLRKDRVDDVRLLGDIQ